MSEPLVDVREANGVWFVRVFLRGELRFVKVKSFRSHEEAVAYAEELRRGGI